MSLSLEAGGSTNTRRGGGDGEDLGGSGRGGGGYHWTRVEVGMTSGGSMEALATRPTCAKKGGRKSRLVDDVTSTLSYWRTNLTTASFGHVRWMDGEDDVLDPTESKHNRKRQKETEDLAMTVELIYY